MSRDRIAMGFASKILVLLSLIVLITSMIWAATAASGWSVSTFASGFINNTAYGPIGIASDGKGNIYVQDYVSGGLYKFGHAGGAASGTTLVGSNPAFTIFGLTFAKDGRLYATDLGENSVVELDPTNAVKLRSVISGRTGYGIATDPISGDLFIAGTNGVIYRISDFTNGPGIVAPYFNLLADGLAFGPDGSLYAANASSVGGASNIFRIGGTSTSQPPSATVIAQVPTSDGMAVSIDNTFLVTNNNNGTISKIDLKTFTQTVIVSGGSRGDFVTVGSDGCLYVTQTDSILKVTSSDGTCPFTPSSIIVPPYTISYYVKTKDSSVLRAAGLKLAKDQAAAGVAQDSVVALLFGAQKVVDGQPGATLWNNNATLADVALLVEDFIVGYYNCFGTVDCQGTSQSNQNMHVRVVVTTNNSGSPTYDQGQQWANMVNLIASRVLGLRYSGRVDIAGGNDMETGYNTPAVTKAWVKGYASVSRKYLYNLGDASCPTSGASTAIPGSSCGTSNYPEWTQEDVYYISWGADPSIPLPEIYCGPCGKIPSTHAKQWTNLSLYGYLAHGSAMYMAGSLTEKGACLLDPNQPTCLPSPNAPTDGWRELYQTVNSDSRTKQTLAWSTDIRHLRTAKDLNLNGF